MARGLTALGGTGQPHDTLVALEQVRLALVEHADSLLHELARLVRQLLFRGREHFLENRDQLGCQLLHGRILRVI